MGPDRVIEELTPGPAPTSATSPARSGRATTSTRAVRVQRAVLVGVLNHLGTLLPVTRLPRTPTACTVGALAGGLIVAGAFVEPHVEEAGTESEPVARTAGPTGGGAGAEEPVAPLGRRLAVGTAFGAVVGVVIAGATWVSLAADAGIEAWLHRRGVARPRVVMGVVGGIVAGLDAYQRDDARPAQG